MTEGEGGESTLYNHLFPLCVTLSVFPPRKTMWRGCWVLLLASLCVAQRQSVSSSAGGERQIRLEDIERDNLAASQKSTASSQQPQQSSQSGQQLSQQQLAAYQQQLLLQQLQQQYFAPSPIAYGNFGGVPLMIIPTNHLGVGSPAGLPIQAYFVPTDPQYLPQYQPQVYQPYPQQRYQQSPSVQRLQPVSQDLSYQVQPSVQTYRQPQNYPSASIVYAGTPHATSFQQPTQQQLYNAYNAIYQQRQEKNSFAAGVKSTPAPPLKPQSQVYSQPPSPTYSNYKTFNYNQ